MSGDLALEIGTNQWIKIEMRELQRDLPRPLPAKVNGAVNIQFGIFEIRAPAQLHIFAMRLRQNGKAAHCFPVKHNIAEINLAIDCGSVLGAGAGQMKPGLPLDREPRKVKTLKVTKFNIGAGEVKMIVFVPKIIANRSGKTRAVVRQLNVLQPRFPAIKTQVA